MKLSFRVSKKLSCMKRKQFKAIISWKLTTIWLIANSNGLLLVDRLIVMFSQILMDVVPSIQMHNQCLNAQIQMDVVKHSHNAWQCGGSCWRHAVLTWTEALNRTGKYSYFVAIR